MPNPTDPTDPDAVFPYGYVEDKESGEEIYDWQEMKKSATRIFKGPWEFRQQFLLDFYSEVTQAQGNNLIFAPAIHPEMGIPASRARVVGKLSTDINPDTGYIKHDLAVIEIEYDTNQNNGSNQGDNENNEFDGQYLEESIESSIELFPIKLNKEVYTGATSLNQDNENDPIVGFDSQGRPLYPHYTAPDTYQDFVELQEATANVRIIKLNYRMTIPYVIAPLWQRIQAALGTINWIEFITPSNLVAAPETLRYDGISGVTKREISANQLIWGLEHMFQYYKSGHNTKPTAEFSAKFKESYYITNKRLEPLLYYPYPHQAIFRNLRTDEINDMGELGTNVAAGRPYNLDEILTGVHINA